MKVYALTIEEVWDYEQIDNPTKVFYTRDDARAELKKWHDTVMKAISGRTWIIETDEADNFEAYELGCQPSNHCHADINECEVMGKKPSFYDRYQALAQEEIDDMRDALEKAGGSYRFEDTFIKVIADLGIIDVKACIVRGAELNDDLRITLEVEYDYEFYEIDASDVLENQIHYITEEIKK